MPRYVEANESLYNAFDEVLAERFQGFANINFRLLFDTKKRVKKGKLVLATVEIANEKIKFFTAGEGVPEGFDYIIIVDLIAWEYATEDVKKKIISHELNHVFIDEKGKYKLVDHDIEDFIIEIKRNKDTPNWASDLAEIALTIYEQKDEM